MFSNMGMTNTFSPSAAEMKAEAESMAKTQKVDFESFHSEVYDLSIASDKVRYIKDFTEILSGLKLRTHVVFNADKQFVPEPNAKWMVFLEWGVFKLIEKDNTTLPTQTDTTKKDEPKGKEAERKYPDGYDDLN